VIGTMIGSGIFLTPTSILVQVNSVGASLCIWAATGVLVTMGSLCYCELALMIKKSGGEYNYIRAAYGDVMAYLFAWTSIIVTKPSSFAIISLGFAQYVTEPFYPGCEVPATIQKLAAVFCIMTITLANCISVKLSNSIQVFFTGAKLLMVVAICVGGIVLLAQGETQNFQDPFEGTSTKFEDWILAFYGGLWSFDGWNQMNFVTEEITNPERNFPVTILAGIPSVTVLYILMNVAYFTVLNKTQMLSSDAVAIKFGDKVFGPAAFLVPVAVACSTFGAANGSAFTGARLTYVAGRNGHMWSVFSYISVERLTPQPAVILNTFISLLMIIPDSSTFSTLIDFFTFASWIFYGLSFFSVVVLRFRHPNWKRPYRVWIWVPIVATIFASLIVFVPLIFEWQWGYLLATLIILLGLVFYVPLVHYKKVPGFLKPTTAFLQQVLEIVPPPSEADTEPIELDTDQPRC